MSDRVIIGDEIEEFGRNGQWNVHRQRTVIIATKTVDRRQVPTDSSGGCMYGNLENSRLQHVYVPGDLQHSWWQTILAGRRGRGPSPFHISQNTDSNTGSRNAGNLNSQDQWKILSNFDGGLSVVAPGSCHFAFCKISMPQLATSTSCNAWVRVCGR